ncbi:hypothetical protein Gotur_031743, partial [Gossypium turneri]
MFPVLPMPYPRYGLTWEFSYRCPCHVLDMVLRGTSYLGANAMSQTWSYMGPLYPNHAKAMSQTWSYMGCFLYCQCH